MSTNPTHVAVLEDDHDRLLEMEAVLAELLPSFSHCFFDNAEEMVGWLRENLADVAFISLDHDLPVVQYRLGKRVDAGCGRAVADFLAKLPPICPILVHSSNEECGSGMVQTLKGAGWPCRRVYPFGEYEWVRDSWRTEIQRYIDEGWITKVAT